MFISLINKWKRKRLLSQHLKLVALYSQGGWKYAVVNGTSTLHEITCYNLIPKRYCKLIDYHPYRTIAEAVKHEGTLIGCLHCMKGGVFLE